MVVKCGSGDGVWWWFLSYDDGGGGGSMVVVWCGGMACVCMCVRILDFGRLIG